MSVTNGIYSTSDYLGLSEAERRVFKSVVDMMTEKGLFEKTDVPLVASYARNVVLAREAAEAIATHGLLIEVTDKYRGVTVKTNPAVDIMNKAQNAYEATAIKLGLTPTGRKRLKGEGKPKKTKLEEFNEQFSD